MRGVLSLAMVIVAISLVGCATNRTRIEGSVAVPAKYRNAMAVRNVSGECNVYGGGIKQLICQPVVPNEKLRKTLEENLTAQGLLASEGAPRYYIDADIKEIRLPLIAVDVDVDSYIEYTVTDGSASKIYPIKATGIGRIVEMPVAHFRAAFATEYALRENFKKFLESLQ